MGLTKLSLKRPVSVFIVVLALIVFGVMAIFSAPLELIPELDMPMLVISTVYPGAGPEDVEELVTQKVEDAVSTLGGVKTVQSSSQENLSLVVLEFEYGTNMDSTYIDLQANLNTITNSLPDTARAPVTIQFNMDQMPVITLSASADGTTDLLYTVEEEIVPELEKLSGVASVSVSGGRQQYISVELKEERLRQYNLDMSSVVNYITAANFSIPVGDARLGSQDLSVRSGADYDTAEALKRIPMTLPTGDVIFLSDVADIFEAEKEQSSLSRYNGNETVSIQIQKRQTSDTVGVSDAVLKTVERLNAQGLGARISVINDSSETIRSAISTLVSTMALGILLSMAVLYLFFGDFRASLIVGSSMPISLLTTFILMNFMGFSLNMMSLGGLVIGVGMMVDNSIVVLESCLRRSGEGLDYKQAALDGATFVGQSVIASTITTVVVFLPLSTMKGMSGQMFTQLGMTIIFSLVASLLSAITLVPLLFLRLHPKEKDQWPFSRWLGRVEDAYGALLRRTLGYKKTVMAIAVGLLVVSVVLLTLLNVELIPSIDEGTISISVDTRPGLNLESTDRIMSRVEQIVAAHPDVDRYYLSAGGGGLMSLMSGGSGGSVSVYLKDDRAMTTAQVVDQWRRETAGMLGCEVSVSSSDTASMMTGGTDVQVFLKGKDLDELRTASKQVEELMGQNPNILLISSSLTSGDPQAEVKIDPLKTAANGMTPVQVATALNNALSGKETVKLQNKGKSTSVWVEYPRGTYENISDLGSLMIKTPAGRLIALLDVADIEFSNAPQALQKEDNQYVVTITGQPTQEGRFIAQKEITEAVARMQFPPTVGLYESDMTARMNEEFSAIGMAILTAVLLVFMVMAMQFESPKFSLMVMLSIPFSLIGSFGLLFIANATVSMVSLMGFLMLVGIVVNNGILFVDTTNQLREQMPVEEALVQTGRTRLRPILMTTLTTVLSMLPMGLGIGTGTELMQGMALVIIGGLVASTLLILLLLPNFYLIMDSGASIVKRAGEKLFSD